MICMHSNSTIEELDQMIKVILNNNLPTITIDFRKLPTIKMVESNTPDHIKNYDIDISCLPDI